MKTDDEKLIDGALQAGYNPMDFFTDGSMKAKALKLKCDVLYSDDSTLLLDLDSEAAFWEFNNRTSFLVKLGFVKPGEEWNVMRSRNGNWHVSVALAKPLSVELRIALQAALGSDWRRDMLSIAGLLHGQQNPVVLFRPKEAVCEAPSAAPVEPL